MSLALALARVDQLEQALSPPAPVARPAAPVASASGATFASVLQGALPNTGVAGVGTPFGGGNQAMVALASAEVGQSELPPGSNDSPRIAGYRQATAGSGVGPWCGYFVSWVAQQAGAPLGDRGEGFGSVDALYAWAQRAGRAVPNGPGVVPRPGDLIVWDEHVGLVEQILPDGRIQTIEGNSSNKVSRNVHAFSDALGFIRMS